MTTSECPWASEKGKRLNAIEFGYDLNEPVRVVSSADYEALLNAIKRPPEPCDRLLKSAEKLSELAE